MTTRSRRWFLRLGAVWSAALVACRSKTAPPGGEPRALGAPVSTYGARSRFDKAVRRVFTNTRVPLEEAATARRSARPTASTRPRRSTSSGIMQACRKSIRPRTR